MQEAVHAAVRELQHKDGHDGLTVPAIAARAGVTPSTIYRRWGDLGQLLSDVARENMRPDAPLPDTGSFQGDFETWLAQYVEEISSELGGRMLRDLVGSTDPLKGGTCAQLFRDQFEVMREQARARGEEPPPSDMLLDRVIAPLVFRILFGAEKPSYAYARGLLDRVLGEAERLPAPAST